MQLKPQLNWANNLRAAATLGVIFIHTSSYLTGSYGQVSNSYWLTSIVMNAMVRWSVPVFVMLTGTFVLEKYDGNIGAFYKKMFVKIILPFLIWSVVYLFFNFWDNIIGSNDSLSQKLHFILNKMITGTAVHLWYVYMIVCIYLVIPIFSGWIRVSDKKEHLWFLYFWFFMLFAYPIIDHYKNDFELGYFTGYIGYLVAGYYIFKNVKLSNILLWVLFLLSLIFTIIGTYYLTMLQYADKELLLAPLTPGVFVMSACVYLLFKQMTISYPSWLVQIVNLICNYSYGIYLIHLLVLALIDDYLLSVADFNPIVSIPLVSIICLSISFCCIYLLRKLPIIGKWVG